MSETHPQHENTPTRPAGAAGPVVDVDLAAPFVAKGPLVSTAADEGAAPAPQDEAGNAVIAHTTPGPRFIWIAVVGGVVALFWAAGVLAYSAGENGLSGLAALPVQGLAGLVFVAFGPALFVFLAGLAVREMARFRGTAREVQALAARFADPAKATTADAQAMAGSVRHEISRMNTAVEGALARLGAMEEVLSHHGDAFAKAEASARERTDVLINDLRREREAIADLASVLDQKAADIAEAISEQSKMVVAAADIANSHAIESTKTLESSASRLQDEAEKAGIGAQNIAQKLDQAATHLAARTRDLDEQRSALSQSAKELDETSTKVADNFARGHEDAKALNDLTQQSIDNIKTISAEGAATVAQAFDEAVARARHATEDVHTTISVAARQQKDQAEALKNAASEAHQALDDYAQVIAKRLEQANEASFSAASWADKTFERLEETTKVLEQKLSALPETADAQARDLHNKLREGLASLNAAARDAAGEAEQMDAAFQSRIRQNYELLSDFMARMGAAADPRGGGALEVPSPFTSAAPEPAPAPLTTKIEEAAPMPPAAAAPKPVIEKEAPPEEVSAPVPEEAVQPEKEEKSGWRWKDVLSGMGPDVETPDNTAPKPKETSEPSDPALAPAAADPLDRLVTLFRIHNIDPAGLFSNMVFNSLAHARMLGGVRAMTDVVQMEAKTAVSALRTAFEDDAQLCAAAESFCDELRGKLDEAVRTGRKIHVETHLRTGDGPAYLLIEAALA